MNILVTGGAGFVGTNLCKKLSEQHNVLSIDNYSAGSKENHIPGVIYINDDCKNINDICLSNNFYPDVVFHLGEYSKIVPSFTDIYTVIDTNLYSTAYVIEYCKTNNIKLVYAASSTKFSTDGENESPYAFSKSKNVQLIKNYSKWYGLQYAICYFYNNYGPYHDTCNNGWETVISIFQKQKEQNIPLTIVAPGTQRRNYTHVLDTIDGLIKAWERQENDEYQLGSAESYNMFELAKLFNHTYTIIPARPGDRMDVNVDLNETYKKLNWKPKYKLKNWIDKL